MIRKIVTLLALPPILVLGLLILPATSLFADGSGVTRGGTATEGMSVPRESIDTRLSPVVPGQRITAGGKNHKVISTSGPVPVSSPPEIQQPKSSSSGSTIVSEGKIGVVIDRRDD